MKHAYLFLPIATCALILPVLQIEARPAKTSKMPPESEWTDLTNAPRKLVGSWKGGRHVTQYLADGSFYTDPHLVPSPPRGQWRIEGDRLIEVFPQANRTTIHNILKITETELVLRNPKGQTFRLFRSRR